MPKIIKNGVTYIGTSDNAAAVTYNNTSSGLSATNVQGAIDEVNSGLSDKMDKVNPTGSGNFSFNATATSGTHNVNLCNSGEVGGTNSFACGYDNYVNGTSNVVGGASNSTNEVIIKDGDTETSYMPLYDTVFGRNNLIDGGSYSIVAGRSNTCDIHSYNSLFGYGLKTSANYQHICGRWNETTSAVEIVGWGSSDSARKNIRTLSTAGNEVLAGTIEATGLGATLKQAVIDAIYPVGSIYMTVSDDTAAKVKARFGGTWVAWGSGRVPIGVNTSDTSFNTVEKTGGGKTTSYTPEGTNESVALTAAQLPKITGTINFHGASAGSGGIVGSATGVFNIGKDHAESSYSSNKYKTPADLTAHTGAASSNQAFLSFGGGSKHAHKFTGTAANISTVQPYITCYMWKRTA